MASPHHAGRVRRLWSRCVLASRLVPMMPCRSSPGAWACVRCRAQVGAAPRVTPPPPRATRTAVRRHHHPSAVGMGPRSPCGTRSGWAAAARSARSVPRHGDAWGETTIATTTVMTWRHGRKAPDASMAADGSWLLPKSLFGGGQKVAWSTDLRHVRWCPSRVVPFCRFGSPMRADMFRVCACTGTHCSHILRCVIFCAYVCGLPLSNVSHIVCGSLLALPLAMQWLSRPSSRGRRVNRRPTTSGFTNRPLPTPRQPHPPPPVAQIQRNGVCFVAIFRVMSSVVRCVICSDFATGVSLYRVRALPCGVVLLCAYVYSQVCRSIGVDCMVCCQDA